MTTRRTAKQDLRQLYVRLHYLDQAIRSLERFQDVRRKREQSWQFKPAVAA